MDRKILNTTFSIYFMVNKVVLFIMDGLGDLKTPLTPLESAKKPNLNYLAQHGMTGLLRPLGPGVTPTSDRSHLVLFGYDLEKDYCGRGPFEALGAGLKMKKGDVAFRANFATMRNGIILDRRAGRINSALAKKLSKEIPKKIGDVQVLFKSTVEHRGALILRRKNLSANITDIDPKGNLHILECESKDNSPRSKRTAEIVNKFIQIVHEKLNKNKLNKGRKLPANVILLRGAGKLKEAESFKKKFGMKAACVAGGALYKGVAEYVGMDILEVKGATGEKNTNLKAKGMAVLKALKKHEFVFLHVKATDSFSHDGDFEGKKKFIEKIDKELVPLLIKSEAGLIITGDHTTPVSKKDHSFEPVPLLVYGIGRDGSKEFDESNCEKGKLWFVDGKELMNIALRIVGRGLF